MTAYIHQLQLSIDHALAVSYRRNTYDGKTTFAAHISIVKGIPFYGYHVGYKCFLKIYMLNPLHMTRLADLLRQGTIMKKVIQPYESHMQYLAQWMCDYNLYGCAYINCSQVRFRGPVPDFSDMNSTNHQWHNRSIKPASISNEEQISRQSHCSIEIDVCVQHILNRRDIKPRSIHHDFIERKSPIALDEKLVQSMAGLWRDETRRRKLRMGETNPGSSPFPPEVLVSVSADPRHSQPGGWIHENEYTEMIDAIKMDEKGKNDDTKLNFDEFVDKDCARDDVQTSLESIEDLYPENLVRRALSQRKSQAATKGMGNLGNQVPQVDEARLLSFEEDDFTYQSDEELAQELEIFQRRRTEHPANDRVDQFADQGTDAPSLGDSRTAANGLTTGVNLPKSTDVQGSSEARNMSGPSSSSELEKLGLRHIGDYSHIGEDTFEIPGAFSSHITDDKIKDMSKMASFRKKRKLEHNSLADSYEPLSEDIGQLVRKICDDAADTNIAELPKLNDREQYRAPRNRAPRQQEIVQKSHLVPSASQEEMLRTNGNNIRLFPIVKDPRVALTLKKLSQSSASPIKSSVTTKAKPVTFAKTSPNSIAASQQLSIATSAQSSLLYPSQVLKTSSQIHSNFDLHCTRIVLCFTLSPPPSVDVALDLRNARAPTILYQDAYFSVAKDVPERAREYAGKEFKIESITVPYLPDFDPTGTSLATVGEKPGTIVDKVIEGKFFQKRMKSCGLRSWEIEDVPPKRSEVQSWVDQRHAHDSRISCHDAKPEPDLSQIDGATQRNQFGFKYSQRKKSTSIQHETQYMSIMSSEIHVNTRGKLVPNPEQDEIASVFWCLQSDDEDLEVNGLNEGTHVGILVLSEQAGLARKISKQTIVEVEEESSELGLINRMVDIVRGYDPDILTGYEVHNGSWGYMIERARCKYDYNLCDEFSRMKTQSHGRFGKEDDRWGFNHTSTIRVTGRHMINIWRAMRGELNLLQYTMENVVFQLCHRRIPHYSFRDLTLWYCSGKPKDLAKVIEYYVSRAQLDIEILEQNELVPRTSEQARLLGVDFFSVFSRGSQFKVESLMFRIAKPENFLLPSPSRKQVGQQNALECLPLVMEPQSAFYSSPLLVLDFQSLYPSVMIAYNYCYSTFLGRVVGWRGQNKMGFTDYHREPRLLELLEGQVNIAPNGIMYAKPKIRKSLLAKMLGEILETRVMVKSGMKVDKGDKTLQRLLNNRQLALKLIANVTYGYTSASFSGRMPCSEIADSIVQTGRETLEKAIALIHSVERWGAEVVYGDTDSLFVYLKGRSKDEAFDIGQEIANTITNMNPRPVKLKFEKVYHPCVLLAKKRYVGFKYESKTQKLPDFDAKGIETVRRDGTPAEQKIEEKALKILFRTGDLSLVKEYFQKQCMKIMKGKVSVQDFCFAKEVKLGTYSDKGLPPPGALISTRKMLEDPRTEPQYGERVPYVVITGAPGARLIDRCVAPDVLLLNDNNDLDAEYYISKNIIPPLERIFNLVGANVRQWYDEMPKFQRIRRIDTGSFPGGRIAISEKKTLESYMKSSNCLVCREKLEEEGAICTRCLQQADTSLLSLQTRLSNTEEKARDLEKVCRSCTGFAWGEAVKCDSRDCPVFYTRTRHCAGLRSEKLVTQRVIEVLGDLEDGALEF